MIKLLISVKMGFHVVLLATTALFCATNLPVGGKGRNWLDIEHTLLNIPSVFNLYI